MHRVDFTGLSPSYSPSIFVRKDMQGEGNITMLSTQSVDMDTDTEKSILYIGVNAKGFCQDMLSIGYIGFSFSCLKKAKEWLLNKENNPSDLPTAIICDVDFPENQLSYFLKKINCFGNLSSIPFILLGGHEVAVEEKDRAKAVRVGADDLYDGACLASSDLENRIGFLKHFKNLKKETGFLKISEGLPERKHKIYWLKRLFDIFVSGVALLVFSPFFLAIGILIRLESRGPVFYVSKRVGSGYHIFDFFKFRTMVMDADAKREDLKHLNQYGEGNDPFFKLMNDPRITKIGAFLRKSSLDELPQLLNVLKGDMSIVGNRPLPLYEAASLTKDQWAQRFLAPAGMTGLWQVNKRGKSDMSVDERVNLDIQYSVSSSFILDMEILFKTIPAMIQEENV